MYPLWMLWQMRLLQLKVIISLPSKIILLVGQRVTGACLAGDRQLFITHLIAGECPTCSMNNLVPLLPSFRSLFQTL